MNLIQRTFHIGESFFYAFLNYSHEKTFFKGEKISDKYLMVQINLRRIKIERYLY